jgi:hypothetical protein
MLTTKTLAILTLAAAVLGAAGCRSNAQTGALFGTGLGAGIGAIIGHQNEHRGAGTLIGAGAGALAGYAIGNEMDKSQQGTRYEGDPRYDPSVTRYSNGPAYRDGGGERVIWRERTIYESDCPPCR